MVGWVERVVVPFVAPWGALGVAGGATRGPVGTFVRPVAVRRGAHGDVAPSLSLELCPKAQQVTSTMRTLLGVLGPTWAEVPTSHLRASFVAATLLGAGLTLLQKVLVGCHPQ